MNTSTPSRANACPSSSAIGPAPNTAARFGKVLRSKTPSLVMRRSPKTFRPSGTVGTAPVAITTLVASMRRASSIERTWRPDADAAKRARPRMTESAGNASVSSRMPPTK